MVFKPATPGFITTLVATVLLAVVSFSVPYFKSIYFLQATYDGQGQSALINFGTLGYCLVQGGTTTCTKPSIGYQFNPNELLGNTTILQIPNVVAKWVTYALFLHVIAFALAGISAIFGLLAHIREFSMVCFSSCISGAAASVALFAFIFDLILFYVARARIRSIPGAQANIGQAVWLTLAAWILLFISGCMFGIGRCCIGSRPRNPRAPAGKAEAGYGGPAVNSSYAEQMRMEAIQAEMQRKARQKADAMSSKESQLPTFEEHETTPLSAGEDLPHEPYRDGPSPGPSRYGQAGVATGYTPPTARRQASAGSNSSQNTAYGGRAGYRQPSDYTPPMPQPPTISYPPSQPSQSAAVYGRQPSLRERDIYENAGLAPSGSGQAGLLTPGGVVHGRGDTYHTQATSYHSARSQQPSEYDPYGQQQTSPAAQHSVYAAYDQSGDDYSRQQQPYNDPYSSNTSAYPAASDQYNTYNSQSRTDDQYNPYNNARQPSVHSQNDSSPSAYSASQSHYQQSSPPPLRQYTTSPPQATSSGYGMPRSGSSGQDLNLPGVAASSQQQYAGQQYQSPVHGNAQLPGGSGGAYSSYSSPSSRPLPPQPGRLPGLQEESEPSTTGRSGVNPTTTAGVPEESPPGYDDPNASRSGYRNEKAVYRP